MSQILKRLNDTDLKDQEETEKPATLTLVPNLSPELSPELEDTVESLPASKKPQLLGLATLSIILVAVIALRFRGHDQTPHSLLSPQANDQAYVLAQNQAATENFYAGKLVESAHLLSEALQKDPKNVTLLINRGIVLQHMHDPIAALDSIRQALLVDPVNSAALNEMGRIQLSIGNYPEAETALNRSLALASRPPEVFLNLAELSEKQEKWASASQYYSHYLQTPAVDPAIKKMIFRRSQNINAFISVNVPGNGTGEEKVED